MIAQLWLAGALSIGMAGTVAAEEAPGDAKPNDGTRYVNVETYSDDAHNRQTAADLSLTVGSHGWLHFGGGRTITSDQGTGDAIHATLVSGGLGLASKHWQYILDYASHTDGDDYKQRDWTSSLTWHNDRLYVGIDGMRRSTGMQTSVSGQRGLVSRMVSQSVDGHGFGAHTVVRFGEHFQLFAGGMSYSYGDVSSQRPMLAQLLYLSGSGITRDQALLNSSYHAGATYQFGIVGMTGQYINDEALDTGQHIRTYELSSTILIRRHWLLTPRVGISAGDESANTTFGGLALTYQW